MYILALGLNGVSEAFVYATAPSGVLGVINSSLLVSSAVFCASAVLLIDKMGTSGILVANILAMGVRTGFNLMFTHAYFKHPERYFRSCRVATGSGGGGCTDEMAKSRGEMDGHGHVSTVHSPVSLVVTSKSPLRDCVLRLADVIALSAVCVLLNISSSHYTATDMTVKDAAAHVSVGAVCFASVLAVFYQSHGRDCSEMVAIVRNRKKRKVD